MYSRAASQDKRDPDRTQTLARAVRGHVYRAGSQTSIGGRTSETTSHERNLISQTSGYGRIYSGNYLKIQEPYVSVCCKRALQCRVRGVLGPDATVRANSRQTVLWYTNREVIGRGVSLIEDDRPAGDQVLVGCGDDVARCPAGEPDR